LGVTRKSWGPKRWCDLREAFSLFDLKSINGGRMKIQTVGVVGGGTMGAGIIQTLSSFGFPVFFKDINETLVKKCLDQVSRIYTSALKKGKMKEEEVEKGLALIQGRTDYNGFEKVDLVVEAVPEELNIKKRVIVELNDILKPEAIVASNTSALSITQLASLTEMNRRSYVIGMHWFNPAHVMKLVEVIPGLETSNEVVGCLLEFCSKLGKVPVRVKECAGFLVNRLLGIYVNESLFMVEEGRKPADIDQAAVSLGLPMGPLTLGDMVGWDIIHHANWTLYEEYGSRFRLPELLPQIVQEGKLGVKVGKGIYLYESSPGGPSQKLGDVKSYLDESSLKQLSERLLLVLINEGVRCLDEGIAEAKDIDRALQLGAGMPKGPLSWGEEVGLDWVFVELDKVKEQFGERYWPSPLLRRKVKAGHLGKKVGKGFFQYKT
jgi:3-hydroxyacyl-CoA dehydrogenase/enoyl-CoA hydratase/3-hydroxybutyryl-CoA epimerase